MNYSNLENYGRAMTFFFLFGTMLFYWIKASFFSINKKNKIEIIALLVCNLCLVFLLLIRWVESKHFPLSNLYESLIFLCWSLNSFLLFLQIKFNEIYVGIIITPIILFINTFATFSLPVEMQKASSLVPALQSNWLMMHVTIMMLSYAALMLGSLLSIAFLVLNFVSFQTKNSFLKKENIQEASLETIPQLNIDPENTLVDSFQNSDNNLNSIESSLNSTLDNLSYRTIGIGFPLLTIGILSGAVWANETWGSYWSWDPKETWALITWFIYAIYLHSRIIKGWEGEKPSFIASFGFFVVWICYLGVNIFGRGLHSYGWFT